MIQKFFIYSYIYYQYGLLLISDQQFDEICIYIQENFDSIDDMDKYLITPEMLSTTSCFNFKGYKRRHISAARELLKANGHDVTLPQYQTKSYKDYYCEKHDQWYGKHLDMCCECTTEEFNRRFGSVSNCVWDENLNDWRKK